MTGIDSKDQTRPKYMSLTSAHQLAPGGGVAYRHADRVADCAESRLALHSIGTCPVAKPTHLTCLYRFKMS